MISLSDGLNLLDRIKAGITDEAVRDAVDELKNRFSETVNEKLELSLENEKLHREISALKKKLDDMSHEQSLLGNYKKTTTRQGIPCVMSKEHETPENSPELYCVQCFTHKKLNLLSKTGMRGITRYECGECGWHQSKW